MKNEEANGKVKKPLYRKWWFWVMIIVILFAIFGKSGAKDGDEDISDEGISFVVSNVRNDVTGKWRIAKIAENIEMQNYALDYYKKYFKSDDEIHAIVNFNYKTTTCISVMGNLLDVTVHEYVDKEEHDAKLLFSGMVLKEYHVNKDTGEIIEIR